jgi:hypothetical protein
MIVHPINIIVKTTGTTMKAMVASLVILSSFSGVARAENSGKESIEAGNCTSVSTI